MNIKKIILKEINEFDWAENIPEAVPIRIGPNGDNGLPVYEIYIGDSVRFISGSKDFVFKLEETDGWGGWGNDMPEDSKWCHPDGGEDDDNKNWHNLSYLSPTKNDTD